MADRTIKLRRLIQILSSFGVVQLAVRGKGSHCLFVKTIDGCSVSYPVPTNRLDVSLCYVRGCRKAFKLTADEGVSDREFYSS